MKKRWLLFWALSLTAILAGCGNGNVAQQDREAASGTLATSKENTAPITLGIYANNAITDDEFNSFFVEPVTRKYPYITLQLVRKGQGTQPEDLVSAGTFPDMILSSYGYSAFNDLGLTEDAEPYLKKFNVDLNRYDPATLQAMRVNDDQGKLRGLPYNMNFSVMYYNKDIFDKFGVAYPHDGMTWAEVTDLARKVTRNDGGVDYRGIDATGATRVGAALSLPFVDPQTNKSLIDSDGWKRVMSMLQEQYQIPGYISGTKYQYGSNAFVKDKTLAMLTEWGNLMTGLIEDAYNKGDKINWDMVAHPNFEGSVGTGRSAAFPALFVTKVGKHKDQAYQALAVIGSDEVQQLMNSTGRLTVMKKTDEFKKSFGSRLNSMKGKDIGAIFSVVPAPTMKATPYDSVATAALTNAEKFIALNQKDVNTALRDAKEEADKAIQAQLGSVVK